MKLPAQCRPRGSHCSRNRPGSEGKARLREDIVVAIADIRTYRGRDMPENRIKELEKQLLEAQEIIAGLTKTNAELTEIVKNSEAAFKRARRTARQDGNTLRDEISVLQRRRF